MPLRAPGARRAARAVALVSLLTATSGLAACSGGDGGGKSSAAASSPTGSASTTAAASSGSPTPSPTPSSTPRPPRAPHRGKDTVAARKAYAAFVVARWSYALGTNDAAAVTGLSPQGHLCQGCKDFASELTKRRKQRWYVDFPGAKVRSVTVAEAGSPLETPPGTYLARAKVDIPASRSMFTNGSFRNDNPAHRGALFEVQMHYAAKQYHLLGFELR